MPNFTALTPEKPVPDMTTVLVPVVGPELGLSEEAFDRLVAQSLLKAGELPGFLHLYVGEEATAAVRSTSVAGSATFMGSLPEASGRLALIG